MTKLIYALVIVVGLSMVASIPNVTLAQSGPPPQAPQPKGGVATVIGVDQPENCLRIRSGPGLSYDVIGCAEMGQQLNITGVWTSNDWAQLADNSWVYGPQIQTDLRPPQTAFSQPESSGTVVESYPPYFDTYDPAYLPAYGYQTFWFGGIPIFLYDINVWGRYHPWWWHKRWDPGHRVWDRNHNLKGNVATGMHKNIVPHRPNAPTSNAARFNSGGNRGAASPVRAGPSQIRSWSSQAGPTRTFSSANTVRMGNVGARSFNSARARSFSAPRFSGGAHFRSGGGGAHFSGGPRFSGGPGGRHR